MEPGKSVEDQFNKLHPCLPLNTRIGIVGAGPSGLSAAYALAKLGYKKVSVLEKHYTVGGMCETVEIEGKFYDLGGQVLAANSAPVIFQLAKEVGAELEEMDSHKLALIDSSTGKYQDAKVADDYVSMISLTLELQDKAKCSGRIGVHAVSEFASDLTPSYLDHRGLKYVPKSVAYGYTASGYGYVRDMPYAYVHEFTRTSMAGKIRRFRGGYTSFWQKISKVLPVEVHCNSEVLVIKRTPVGVSVDVKSNNGEFKLMEFDKIIVSGAFPFRNGKTYGSPLQNCPAFQSEVMDLGELENELFSKVQTIDYYTTVLKIKGFEHLEIGFYYFGEYMEDPATIGHPVAMQKFYADTDIFLFWSYGNSVDIIGSAVTQFAINTVKSMGGDVEKVVLQRRFKYFPHVGSQDMKEGFYEKLESELQGLRNTYYIGGLMAFELTERNSSYAMSLVCKHFARNDSLPTIPYVKNLFSFQEDYCQRRPQELGELPGVEFPNLASLDSYLKHWGTHEVTRHKTLYTWVSDEGAVVCKRTYAELHTNACCIAHKLLTSHKPAIKPGDRVLLVYVPGLDFVDAFFGCLRAKVLPVPVLPPDPLQKGGQALTKIANIAKSCNAVAILSTLVYHSAVRAGSIKNLISFTDKNWKSSVSWPKLPWLHTDSWINSNKNLLPEAVIDQSESQPHDLSFLQFTSGSTGDPKGVMITHGGLIHNVKMMTRRYKSTSKTVLVSWLPQYHDMGLIGGLFTALVSGGSAILFSPMSFIKNPLLWLQTLSKYHATHSAGPNFAFELIIRRLESNFSRDKAGSYDLSSLIFLMVAAEPVRQKTLKRFVELMRPFGLSEEVMAPGYGLAENCVFVSCAYGQRQPIFVDWQGRVCCGYVDPDDADVDVRIVNPDSAEEIKEAGKEGEIWISSPSAGVGYWGREDISQKTFRNELRNYPGRTYTRTGDLGRIIDGKLFITGRIKDLIIIAGRNIYSADVEKTVESSSELLRPGCCAVVGVPEDILSAKGISIPDGSDQVGLVVIAEVRDGKPVDKAEVEHIKTRVTEEHGVTVASVKLVKPRTIGKTTSGKIKRFQCLKEFSDGTLNVLPDPILSKRTLVRSFTTGTCREGKTPRPQLVSSPISRAKKSTKEIAEFLKGLVSEQTGVPMKNISTTENLVSYGIDSIGVVRAAQKLSDFLGVPVGAVDIFTATCIDEVVSFSENLLMKSQPELMASPISIAKKSNKEIVEFLKGLVSEQTGVPMKSISATENLASYGVDSIGVVRAAQKLSDFLGVPVGAVDIFTATCIDELASFSENLLLKSKPELMASPSHFLEADVDTTDLVVEVSKSRQMGIWFFQLLALIYVMLMLSFPVYISVYLFTRSVSASAASLDGLPYPWTSFLIPLVLAPLFWMLCTVLTCISVGFFGNSFLEPNYAMSPEISMWSTDFVKWWAVYKAKGIASKVFAEHLRGTVFLNYWFEMLGARIGSSVVLDTVDITDPSLVSIGDGAVIAEGALVQSHEVKNGVLSFSPIRIGRNSSVGPYAIIQKGSILGEEAEVLPLQKSEGGKPVLKSTMANNVPKGAVLPISLHNGSLSAIYQVIGIYAVGFLSSLSAAIIYFIYIWQTQKLVVPEQFAFLCISGAFHWIPFTIIAYATIFADVVPYSANFAILLAIAYLAHGLLLSFFTCGLTHFLAGRQEIKQFQFKTWLCHRINIACHIRFTKLFSGTEAFCMYLRLLGAKVGKHCSIRAINPVSDPGLITIGAGVHLGDFSRIISGFYTSRGFIRGKIEVQDNSIVGSQSLVLPGAVVHKDVILGALSVAPVNSVLQSGGVYVGSQTPVMIKSTMHSLDDRIEEMDTKYKKIVGNLAANLAATTLKVRSRYFHRIGISGKGQLKIYDNIEGLPDHKVFHRGKSYPVIIRHSNSLSADDDARIDARGAAVRILSNENDNSSALLDLTLKTGKAFYARTISDFATWLVCGLPAREEHVKRVPHVRDAVWTSLRHADSYVDLHYYSNICRLFRFTDGQEMYVKFKLRPCDESIDEDAGNVEPRGILPPETGAIPRDESDTRPLLFLADDFQRRVNSPGGVRYIFQLQIRPIPRDEANRDIALDCTRPWDENEFPYINVGEISISQNLTSSESEKLEYNPYLKCHEVDVIQASSSSQSASIDHGRSLIYEICQHLRNGEPLPEAWRIFIEQSDVKVDLSGCPMAAALQKKDSTEVTLARTWYQTLWVVFAQPLLQTVLPYFLMGLVIYAPLNLVLSLKETNKISLHWLLPFLWVSSGLLAALACAVAKWVLVGKREAGETAPIWSKVVFMDTIWQAFRTLVCDYFMEITSGSIFFALWMKLMGSNIELDQCAYVDSMGALLNPEMVEIERGGCIGRGALLFGHVYEGEGKVKFGKIRVEEGGFVGSRAVVMPGVRVESGGCLTALSLAMKEESIRSK